MPNRSGTTKPKKERVSPQRLAPLSHKNERFVREVVKQICRRYYGVSFDGPLTLRGDAFLVQINGVREELLEEIRTRLAIEFSRAKLPFRQCGTEKLQNGCYLFEIGHELNEGDTHT